MKKSRGFWLVMFLLISGGGFAQVDLTSNSVVLQSATECLVADQIYSASINITNIGNIASPTAELQINYWGKLMSYFIGPLNPGQTTVVVLQNEPFEPVPDQLYGITLRIDPNNQIAESNEGNNQRTGGFLPGCQTELAVDDWKDY